MTGEMGRTRTGAPRGSGVRRQLRQLAAAVLGEVVVASAKNSSLAGHSADPEHVVFSSVRLGNCNAYRQGSRFSLISGLVAFMESTSMNKSLVGVVRPRCIA